MVRVLFLVTVFLALPTLGASQGLGDAARKEKERRVHQPTSAAKTYTQDDIKNLPPVANEADGQVGPAAPLADDVAPSRAAGTSDSESTRRDAEASARARDEERWRSRVADARERVETARKRYTTLAGLNLVPGYEYQDSHGRTVIGSVAELQGLTARAKADLEAAEKALENLLEEARRASVPPGWLR